MRSIKKRYLVVTVLSMIFGVALKLTVGNNSPGQNEQMIDLAIVEELLHSREQTSAYHLIPNSVMTGLCWYAGDGSKEGVFKDVNAGMAYWRDRAPVATNVYKAVINGTAESSAETGIDYAKLSDELDQLSFEATGYTFTNNKAEITGILSYANSNRRIALSVDLPEQTRHQAQQDLIELYATTAINPYELANASPASDIRSVDLCISMQAARNTVLARILHEGFGF